MTKLQTDTRFLRMLVIEDNRDDVDLIILTLKKNFPNAEYFHVPGKAEFVSLIENAPHFDVILSDWSLPQFNGLEALATIRAKGIDAPFLIVSGKIGEEAAIQAIRQGVYDYVLKDNLARLPTSISHALEAHENEKKAKIDNALIALQATALRISPNAIILLDSEGSIEWVNPAFEKLTGYSNNEVIAHNVSEFCLDSDCLSLDAIKNDPVAQKEYFFSTVERKKDGSRYFEERRICTVIDQEGRLTHFVIIKQDVTPAEQKKRELELEVLFSNAIKHTRGLEALCMSTISFIKEQFPDANPGLCLYTDGTTAIEKWFGQDHRVSASSDSGEARSQDDVRLFRYEIAMLEEKIGLLVMQFSINNAFNFDKLFAGLARQLETALQQAIAQQRILAQIRNISFLKLISRTINAVMDFDTVMGSLLKQIRKLLDGDAVALYLYDKETDDLVCRAKSGFKTGLVQGVHIKQGQAYVGIAAEEQRIVSVSNFDDLDPQSQFFSLTVQEEFTSQHCAPIIIGGKTIGVLELFQRKPFVPTPEWLIFFDAIATQTGLALDYNTLYAELQKTYLDLEQSYEATIEGWSSAMDFRDQETEGHSKRVTSLTVSLAARWGIPEDEIAKIRRGALLHDIGKIGIPDSVLKKQGPLDEEEWKLMRQHPRFAYEMLSRVPYLKGSLDIPLYHHEKWDGSGYPEGLKGDKIPLAARLFSVVDVFDALTSDRPYRKAWSKEDTINYIRAQSGKHFDPEVVNVFIAMIAQ